MQFRLWRAAAFVSSPIHLLSQVTSSRQLAQNNKRLVSWSLSWWTACPVVGRQTSEVSVHWHEPWCDDWGMSVLWLLKVNTATLYSILCWMGNQCSSRSNGWREIVLELGERSWLHCFALAVEPECCWLEHRTALSCSSPVWSVWECHRVFCRQ